MSDREEFEKWARKAGVANWRHPNDADKYYCGAAQNAWLAWQAARQQAVPSGYVMVPVEPTREMLEALDEDGDPVADSGEYYFADVADFQSHMRRIYRAMLAAAPQAEQAGEPVAILCREIGETSWFDHNPLVPGSPTDLARQRSPQWDTCRVFAEAPPAPDVSGLVEALESIANEAREMGIPWAVWTAERALAIHQQEGK